jgi:lipid-binding SYLF domain-containing protein
LYSSFSFPCLSWCSNARFKVIANAKGIAIFTTMRTGLWVSGAGGSGVLVARLPDGSWSGPSGILLHTAGLGFLVGVDIYDCVVVINTQQGLDAFSKLRCTLGGEVSAVAGPVGVGGLLETEVHKRQAPVWTYLKSRGFYAGIQVDGTVIIERTDENERFYGQRIGVTDILAGKVRHIPYEVRMLHETLKIAAGGEGDHSLLPTGETPGDADLEDGSKHAFGIPDENDDDPYGAKALEAEGLEIREAGTNSRASMDEFTFRKRSSTLNSSHSRLSQDVGTQFDSDDFDQFKGAAQSGSGSSSPTVPTGFAAPVKRGPPPALPPREVAVSSPLKNHFEADIAHGHTSEKDSEAFSEPKSGEQSAPPAYNTADPQQDGGADIASVKIPEPEESKVPEFHEPESNDISEQAEHLESVSLADDKPKHVEVTAGNP